MQLVAVEKFTLGEGRYSLVSLGSYDLWIMERIWRGNRRNVSSVPRGEYKLELHHGTKYPNTWALVGLTVAAVAEAEPWKSRSACVIHRAKWPTDLEGCLSFAYSISASGEATGYEAATAAVLAALDLSEQNSITLI